MPLQAIREVLTGQLKYEAEGLAGSTGIIQKRINLEPGYRYTVTNVQMFNENGRSPVAVGAGPQGEQYAAQLAYVTPYPITLTDNAYGFEALMRGILLNNGPFMGDESVIYKRLDISVDDTATNIPQTNRVFSQEFPDPALEKTTALAWYTPHVYLTCIQQSHQALNQEVSLSFYLEVEKVKCSALETSIGMYKEFLEAQCRLLTETANLIDPSSSAAGRSFPSWKYGGIKPEIMVTSANALRYYNKLASRAYQEMDSITGFQTRFKQATTMSAYDEPFGDTATNIPDWITLMDVSGVTSGIIRPYPPPVKFSGNGNTVMYDADGLPASVVT